MRVAITGATGLVGRFFVEDALLRNQDVLALGRDPGDAFSAPVPHLPYRLGDRPDLRGIDTLIHCAFAHVPGRYRGGEGDDPQAFKRTNLDGSISLFEAAKAAGVRRVVFLSSRAVYGSYPAGTVLTEDLPPIPDTLYGQIKWQAEQALCQMSGPQFKTHSLRATGVYGAPRPGQTHKWEGLFGDHFNERTIAPRQGTELHGQDLAHAAHVLRNAESGPYNVSDILLDRHKLFSLVNKITGCKFTPPRPVNAPYSELSCEKLHSQGWQTGGWDKLRSHLSDLLPS